MQDQLTEALDSAVRSFGEVASALSDGSFTPSPPESAAMEQQLMQFGEIAGSLFQALGAYRQQRTQLN